MEPQATAESKRKMTREPAIHHCTSQPLHFFGRRGELALLDEAVAGGAASVAAFVGPGGQGKTAIVQHWLRSRAGAMAALDGCFLWSFYRGKESDLCLRQLFAYAEGMPGPPDVSASFCVDRLIPRLRAERWAIVLDGTEVVQHEQGAWRGRFIHPELGRLIETLAEEPMPGVLALTTRFELPTLGTRRHARLVSLGTLDDESAIALLTHLGVAGTNDELWLAIRAAGGHAKAVELLGTWLARFHEGRAADHHLLPPLPEIDASDEERHVLRILTAYHQTLPQDAKDMVAFATHFHQPPTEACLIDYLRSEPVERLLHGEWKRSYAPWSGLARNAVARQVQEAVDLRLLERVSLSLTQAAEACVLDAHPLVRRGFESVLGAGSSGALARAGFLRGRPDRKTPANLAEAREEVELFHALCAAGLWTEADDAFRGLDNPKHRFLAPAFERDLLLRFFPEGDWREPPLWPGFGRYRSLAICCEMLGQFEEALAIYRPADAALGGDALLALGRLDVILATPVAPHPWQSLWQAYRGHALCLAGRMEEASRLVAAAWPVDVYEWVHYFEAILRLGRLDLFDPLSLDAALRNTDDSQWTTLARRRMRADYFRLTGNAAEIELAREYQELVEAYDRAGLPVERVLVRLGQGRYLWSRNRREEAASAAGAALDIARRQRMPLMEADAAAVLGGREWGRP
jgi:tetratricopeptide (TPR) repeat protein